MTTTGTWYPPSAGTEGFLAEIEGQLFTNPPFKMTTPTKYRATTTAVTTHQEGTNFDLAEQALTLQMVDEGGGAFFLLSQDGGTPLRVELAELELLVEKARELLAQPGVGEVEP